MATKADQLQIRVTTREKATLKRLARAAGMDVSAYVLARALPRHAAEFARLLETVRESEDRRLAFAELRDLLASLVPGEFDRAVGVADVRGLDPVARNYVAAMVEEAAAARRVAAPEWVREIAPLEEPYFGATLRGLRPHLLRVSPVAFKRRNIFVDPGAGRV